MRFKRSRSREQGCNKGICQVRNPLRTLAVSWKHFYHLNPTTLFVYHIHTSTIFRDHFPFMLLFVCKQQTAAAAVARCDRVMHTFLYKHQLCTYSSIDIEKKKTLEILCVCSNPTSPLRKQHSDGNHTPGSSFFLQGKGHSACTKEHGDPLFYNCVAK